MIQLFTVYPAVGPDVKFERYHDAVEYGRKLAARGIMSECRDNNFDHVFTMGEN